MYRVIRCRDDVSFGMYKVIACVYRVIRQEIMSVCVCKVIMCVRTGSPDR